MPNGAVVGEHAGTGFGKVNATCDTMPCSVSVTVFALSITIVLVVDPLESALPAPFC